MCEVAFRYLGLGGHTDNRIYNSYVCLSRILGIYNFIHLTGLTRFFMHIDKKGGVLYDIRR